MIKRAKRGFAEKRGRYIKSREGDFPRVDIKFLLNKEVKRDKRDSGSTLGLTCRHVAVKFAVLVNNSGPI